MTSTDYTISLLEGLISPLDGALVLRDGERERLLELNAQARSGYYFVDLATKLETIASSQFNQDVAPRLMLERIIQDLDYLQEYYQIVKKPTSEDFSS